MEISGEADSDKAIVDVVTRRICEKLEMLISYVPCPSCVFKVPNHLRSVNDDPYEPQIVAIGPLHHGKPHLIAMEEHKLRYLRSFLLRSDESVSRYVQIILDLEVNARNSYAEPVSHTTENFVEMMLLDGCFIIEFLCRMYRFDPIDRIDVIIGSNHMLNRLMVDLLLLENQLPLFILKLLVPNITEVEFIRIIFNVFGPFLPRRMHAPIDNLATFMNLLGFFHNIWQPSDARGVSDALENGGRKKRFIGCATDLTEAGIKFKSLVDANNLFDIKFKNGIIEIPEIRIGDETERLWRNLIAYEQLTSSRGPQYFSNYIAFMDDVIDSAKDVEILRSRGIIVNRKVDDETIAILFNKIGKNVFCDRALYADIVEDVDKHCEDKWNRWMSKWNQWMANLWDNYFNTPWAFISFLAAIMLLLLAWTQTVYTVLSYYK
ncbi:hypothetical protein P3X46_005015 [Hevea brasiliensis]|uniref:Uncharacterized protein n=1 Tax=Hevea brasiliensis TaxID=3981 RepID=A0ABQ9MZC1_HEVBR|nr:UPF0481 protein At3g47200 [Hevea brasiliensis]XP_021648900.2 UPF0481 protein At3g47200 [Hevea brasiliensis]XP_021648901.2 UPF0481 protein At3g47200 [Hevea brasiliensis]XP_021648903.2 UPF0481 protein At3g47200 [Hevea brasiliensis]KAJ9185373.1 hypothetical protein P3X46_005015 [Hevea brasiliensis]